MKTEVMSVSEFLNRKPERVTTKLERHFKKYGFVYKVVGTTVIILTTCGFDYSVAASTGIEVGARKLYYEIVNVGKWIIVFKGGIDMIKAAGNGDFDSAKKTLFTSILIFLFLYGLPYGMDKVDEALRNNLPKV